MDNLHEQLTAIHKKVKAIFTYKEDLEQYRVAEKWVMPKPDFDGSQAFEGDCEDFALACRKLCREAGIPTRLVVCELYGVGHCVLEASGWIFDNNYSEVIARDDLTRSHKWQWISGYEPGDQWNEIK